MSKNERAFRNSGYTFVEMMFAFFISLSILFLLPDFIRVFIDSDDQELAINVEVDLFYQQLSMELRQASAIDIDEGGKKLVLLLHHKEIVYGQYGSFIRRTVNATGHELVLQEVKKVGFQTVSNGIMVSIESIEDGSYIKRLSLTPTFAKGR